MRVSAIRFWVAPITIAAVLSSAGSAQAWTAKYQCDVPVCGYPCVEDGGSCHQPVECQLVSEDDPNYDGCSVPTWLLATGWIIEPVLWSIVAEYMFEFGESTYSDSPCFIHDQCYRMGGITYGRSRAKCDHEFYDRMMDQCTTIPRWRFMKRIRCKRAAEVFAAAVIAGGEDKYNEKRQTCCDYASTPGAMTAVCLDAYAAQHPDPPGAPPIPEDCIGLEGQCRGGACAPVDPNGDLVDPSSEFHPNGDFDPEWRCDITMGLVCNDVGGEGRCQECGIDTMLGCGCSTNEECNTLNEPGLTCRGGASEGWPGGGGRCWPINDVPDWHCANNCAAISYKRDDDNIWSYYCQHTGVAAGECLIADFGIVPAHNCYPLIPMSYLGDECTTECTSSDECIANGWPSGTHCVGNRCML